MSAVKKMIEARDLHKSFDEVQAVNGLSLQVREGEIYGLVGPDGAGKTTTIRLLCGALLPDSGEVSVGGRDMGTHPDQAREQIGYLSQRFSLYEELTVFENLRFFAEVRGIAGEDWRVRTMEILEFVGLADFIDRQAGYLSGGMKQKLGLATALVHRPRVLLLDEPTGGVDPVTRQDFWQLIIRLVTEEGISVLVSTPYMDEAVRCTYVGLMRDGHIVIEDKPQALKEQLNGRILELRGGTLRALRGLVSEMKEIEDVQIFGNRLHLRVKPGLAEAISAQLQKRLKDNGIADGAVRVVRPQLEDAFIAMLQNDIAMGDSDV